MRTSLSSAVGCRLFVAAALAAVAGCGALQPPGGAVLRYEYKRPDGRAYVRVEKLERDAPPNDQPSAIQLGQVRMALAGVREKAPLLLADQPVLSADELDELAPRIASALATATPAEDVTFGALGSHGLFNEHSPQTATTGRVFVRGGKLNLVFGLVQSSFEAIDLHGTTDQLTPGRRRARVEPGWTLAAPGAQMVDNRGDWLAFDVASLVPPKPRSAPVPANAPNAVKPSTAAPAADESRYQDMASRLRILDRLRADGLVSEEEYRERRRAILQSL
jgi:hypothetical protein